MAKEFFRAHFRQGQFDWKARLPNSANYYLSSLFFNAFPLPQRETGTRQTLRYIGTLMGEGYSLLIFPEGKRTDEGEINRFQAGVGMIASKLGFPVVPVRLEGLDRILHQRWKFPQRGRGRVAFGPAYVPDGERLRGFGRSGGGRRPTALAVEFAYLERRMAQSLIERIAIEQG